MEPSENSVIEQSEIKKEESMNSNRRKTPCVCYVKRMRPSIARVLLRISIALRTVAGRRHFFCLEICRGGAIGYPKIKTILEYLHQFNLHYDSHWIDANLPFCIGLGRKRS